MTARRDPTPFGERERILLRLREEVAQATERAYRDLRAIGVDRDKTSRS